MPEQPLWVPDPAAAGASAMGHLLLRVRQAYATNTNTIGNYDDLHRWSVEHFEDFWQLWLQESGVLHEGESLPVVQHRRMPNANFFPGVRLNFAENLLRRRDDGVAIVSVSEARPDVRLTYAQLYREVCRVRAGLQALGVQAGDRVAAFVPNVAETMVAMLATASLGAVWSSCSPDFGVQGAVDRFGQIKPRVLIACNAYVYHGKTFDCADKCRGIAAAIDSVERVVIINLCSQVAAPQESKFVSWDALHQAAPTDIQFERFSFNQPLYILYSSGTTGIPKCIVHGAGGTLLQHIKELSLHSDLRRDDNLLYFTTCGWMMWQWMASALFLGCTVTLFDGSPTYPTFSRMWELVQHEGVTHFGTSAKFLASCRGKMSPKAQWPAARLRVLLSTGSPLSPEDFDWVYGHVGDVQLSSISGGTDIVSCFILGNPLLPVYRGEIQAFGLGMDVVALDEQHRPVAGGKGELACRTPFVSMPVYFWDDADGQKYHKAYFERLPGTWVHGDTISVTGSQGRCGGIVVYGRSDATLKPGGVRIGTAEIYRLVETIPQIEDSIVVGQPWEGDVRVVLFCKLAAQTTWDMELEQRIKSTIRAGATPRHVPAVVLPVDKIPYTKSGKKMELAVLEVITGGQPKNLESMQDASAVACYQDLAALR